MRISRKKKQKYTIGIDEVGRGPLAGPVAVGAVCIYAEHHRRVTKLFPIIKDSKKLSQKAREACLEKIDQAKCEGWLEYTVAFIPPSVIDKMGLSYAIRTALARTLKILDPATFGRPTSKCGEGEVMVLLDGGLRAPSSYLNQETIIKGDEKELVIALASIVAKVARDARMVLLAKKFPEYGFEKHKGYGTRAHYEAIKQNGLTKHHRKSFLKDLV